MRTVLVAGSQSQHGLSNISLIKAMTKAAISASNDYNKYIVMHPQSYKKLFLEFNPWILTRKKWLKGETKMSNLCKCTDSSICSPEWESGLCRKDKLQETFCKDEGCPHHGTTHICVSGDLKYLDSLTLKESLAVAKKIHESKPQDEYRKGVLTGLSIAIGLLATKEKA